MLLKTLKNHVCYCKWHFFTAISAQSQWAEMYVALSLGLENLLSYDRDKEIAARAFKRGASVGEVEEIIVASPVDWTRDEARVIASLALSHLEQSRERLRQKQSQLERERELRQLEREQLRQQQKPSRNQDWGMSL